MTPTPQWMRDAAEKIVADVEAAATVIFGEIVISEGARSEAVDAAVERIKEHFPGGTFEEGVEAAARVCEGWREYDWPEETSRRHMEFCAQNFVRRIRSLRRAPVEKEKVK